MYTYGRWKLSGKDHFRHMIYPFDFLPSNNTRDSTQIEKERKIIENGIFNSEFNFTLRKISDDDLSILRYFYEKPIDLGDFSFPYEGKFVFDDHNPATRYSYHLFISALRLLKTGNVYLTHTFRKNPYTFSLSIAPIPRYPQYHLHYNEYDDILCLMRKIQKIINIEDDYRKTSLYFFNSSYTRLFGNKTFERLIDLMNCAESLFTHEDQYGQKRLSIAHTASILLGESDVDREDIKKVFMDAYMMRNKYVHGSRLQELMRKVTDEHGDFETFTDKIEENIRKAIKKLI